MIHLNYPFDKEVLFNSWKSTYHKYLKKMHEMIILNKKNLTEEETESEFNRFCLFMYENSSKYISRFV